MSHFSCSILENVVLKLQVRDEDFFGGEGGGEWLDCAYLYNNPGCPSGYVSLNHLAPDSRQILKSKAKLVHLLSLAIYHCGKCFHDSFLFLDYTFLLLKLLLSPKANIFKFKFVNFKPSDLAFPGSLPYSLAPGEGKKRDHRNEVVSGLCGLYMLIGSLSKHNVDGSENIIWKSNFAFLQSFFNNYSKSICLKNLFQISWN